MNNTVNLEEILKEYLTVNTMRANNPDYTFMMVLSAMKEAVRRALELAAENANIGIKKRSQYGKYRKWQKVKEEEVDLLDYEVQYSVDKESILNTINQVV